MNAYGSTSARKIGRSCTLPINVSFALFVSVAVILGPTGVYKELYE